MITPTRHGLRSLQVAVSSAFLLIAMSTTGAAEVDSADTAVEAEDPLVELAEVKVRGKKLVRLIEDTEDKLYKRYNKLNKNDDYDIHCGTMSMEPGSMIMVRTCLPGFITNQLRVSYSYHQPSAMLAWAGSTTSIPTGGFPIDAAGGAAIPGMVVSLRGAPRPADDMSHVPASVVSSYRRQAYYDNVLTFITENEELNGIATELAGLYEEMELVQGRFARLKPPGEPATKPRLWAGFQRHR